MRLPLLLFAFALLSGCSHHDPKLGLIPLSTLGKTRNFHFKRTLTHFHSPFSYDACDDKGVDGKTHTVNQDCVNDVREAVCMDHEDVIFASDHPNNMARYPFEMLLMHAPEDEWILSDGKRVGNRIHCPDGTTADWYPGIESRLLAWGLEHHSSENVEERIALYNGEDLRTRNELEAKTGALIGIPHTESREIEYLEKFKPVAIEIYNLHAALDPRINQKYLHQSVLSKAWVFARFLLDPFNTLDANYIFPEFYEISPTYFEKWDDLQSKGILSTATAGADSHQTIFRQKMSDGERLDHHRRMIRFFSNWLLTEKDDEASLKEAIVRGRNYVVIEALGTPTGLDFHAVDPKEKVIAEMGDQISQKSETLVFRLPTLYPTPEYANDPKPEITADLVRVNENGKESVVKTSDGTPELRYANPAPGHYRIHVWIKPHHLKNHLYTKKLSDKAFLWVISNPIHIIK